MKMKKKTVIPLEIKAAIRDTLVELATIKSTSKQLQKVQNPNPVTPGLDDSRSLFLSNFGLKPVVGNSGSLDIKPRRASKRLKSQTTAPSPPPLVSDLNFLLSQSDPRDYHFLFPSTLACCAMDDFWLFARTCVTLRFFYFSSILGDHFLPFRKMLCLLHILTIIKNKSASKKAEIWR